MEMSKVKNHMEIYEKDEIAKLVYLCSENPTIGKLKSASQAIYSKQQGVFYKAIIDKEIVGIIGAKKINSDKLELKHIAVEPKKLHRGIGKQMILKIIEIEKVEHMFCEVDHKIMEFFKKCDFTCKLVDDENGSSEKFYCFIKSNKKI